MSAHSRPLAVRAAAVLTAAAVGGLAACGAPSPETVPDTSPAPARPNAPSASASADPAATATSSLAAAPSSSPAAAPSSSSATPPAELPRGGRQVFPRHRLVGFAGGRAESFGRLGIGDIDRRAAEIERFARWYTPDAQVPLPVFEIIAVVAQTRPTSSGLYRTVEPARVIDAYLAAARRRGAMLLLGVQPGRADFLPQVRRLRRWLVEPDVGLALDPEWAVGPHEVPGLVIGATTGSELDEVAAYLSELVARHDLPEKVMVYHQFHAATVTDEQALRPHPGVAIVKSVDGVGSPALKRATWRTLTRSLPEQVHTGFKLFFDEDARSGPLMRPSEVLALRPRPSYVLYE